MLLVYATRLSNLQKENPEKHSYFPRASRKFALIFLHISLADELIRRR